MYCSPTLTLLDSNLRGFSTFETIFLAFFIILVGGGGVQNEINAFLQSCLLGMEVQQKIISCFYRLQGGVENGARKNHAKML